MKHNFKIVNCDTDSISFCKEDMTSFSKEEQEQLVEEINSLLPEKIKMAHDGYYTHVLIAKAKNYALFDGKKLKIKGSALKAPMKEKKLKGFIDEVIKYLMDKRGDELPNLYNSYAKEICTLTDITGWSLKKTITQKVLDPKRTNEQNIKDALDEEETYSIGDKAYLYFTKDKTLKLALEFDPANPDHDESKLLEKLYKTISIFENVVDITKFINYKLKKHKNLLAEVLKT